MIEWITELTRQLHDPPTMNNPEHVGKLQTILTNGAADAIYKVILNTSVVSNILALNLSDYILCLELTTMCNHRVCVCGGGGGEGGGGDKYRFY